MITEGILWICLLGYVIYTATGSQIEDPETLSSLNKILIYGGYECQPHSQPWQAALFSRNKFACGGVLVHPQWVLSAAHCGRRINTVGLGLHSLDSRKEPGTQTIQASTFIIHPQYNRPRGANDLMLIKLSKPAVESNTVRPINVAFHSPYPGNKCLISGWGKQLNGKLADVLQCLEVRVVPMRDCRAAIHQIILYKMICSGGEENKGVCLGDSGGPLVCNGFLKGIHNWVTQPCGNPGDPDIHADLAQYRDWIEETIRTT